ncbi:AraC family transcriptional regulator [Oscillospiraceae bacterium HV4-5-C5C]|nr:AraC family transcriptional regulator [Oscillospiraceae bacterium HV4-5-C5C]
MALTHSTGHKSRIFLIILLFGAGAIAVSIFLASALLYYRFNKRLQQELINSSALSNQYLSSQVESALDNAATLTSRINSDYLVKRLLNQKENDIYDLNQVFTQLTQYKLSHAAIQSIYLYNSGNDTLYVESDTSSISSIWDNFSQTKADFPDQTAVRLMDQLVANKPYLPIFRVIDATAAQPAYCYTYLAYDSYSKSEVKNFILVNFYYDQIFSAAELQPDSSTTVLAMDQSGQAMTLLQSELISTDSLNQLWSSQLRQTAADHGFFTTQLDGTTYLLSYDKDNRFGWTFISLLPWSVIGAKLKQLKLITLLSDGLIFLLLLVMAYFVSGKIYRPISAILADWSKDKNKLQSAQQVMRQIFLHDVVLGKVMNTKEYLSVNCSRYQIQLAYEDQLCLVLLQLDQFSSACAEISVAEQNALKDSILQMAQNEFILDYQTEGCSLEQGQLALLLIIPATTSQESAWKNAVQVRLAALQQAVRQACQLSLSAAVSELATLAQIAQLYQDCQLCLEKHFFSGDGCILFTDTTAAQTVADYVYPDKLEKKLIEALNSARAADASLVFEQILSGLADYPLICTSIALTRLTLAVKSVLRAKRLDIDFQLPLNTGTVSQVQQYFIQTTSLICRRIQQQIDSKYSLLIDKVDKLIHAEYANAALSVDLLADRVGISVSYLCRLYKQYTGQTLLDQIQAVRLDKAKALLAKSKLSVAAIAAATGFSSASYFNKVFKKACDVTPNHYRQACLRAGAPGADPASR